MRFLAVAAALLLAGCGVPLTAQKFGRAGPAFDPLAFFTGHETSWGVEENRAGQPVAIVTTDCLGTPDGPGRIRMVQVLHVGDAAPQTRVWRMTRTGPGVFTATANDMAGNAVGIAAGPAFHWRWVLETAPGDALKNVTMDQWMYRMADGAVMVRTVVTKLGVRLVEISEEFEKA
jgi:hypothetical protein